MPLYCYSTDNERFEGKFESITEAQLACILSNELKKDDIYYIGEVKEFTSRSFIGVFNLVSEIKQQAQYEVGKEVVGSWPDVSPSKYHEIREMLVDFFEKNYPVTFNGVENVKSMIVD